ncbi:MAG: peptidoglycan editing factor PgeF, partial [Candidatus Gastranaerophilales bacterium]|nr:peptidoglycan editing factor PgeF [Candidatus Gastranaerophilales bacterium]
HSSNAAIVSEKEFFYDNTDSLISNIENTLLILNFADCVPIILYSREDNTGAIIHAGWRGTADKIAQKTVLKMKNILHINPENITALIGPSIGKCCFETDEDVFLKLIEDKTQTQLHNLVSPAFFDDSSSPKNWGSPFQGATQKFRSRSLSRNFLGQYNKHNDKYFIDLKLLNKFQLEKEGVKNIDICSYCTCCMSDIFFSYRKEQGITARHSAVLQIKRG